MTRNYLRSNLSVLTREYKMYKQHAVSFNLPTGKHLPSECQTDIKNNHPVKDQSLIVPPSPPKKLKKKRITDSVNQTGIQNLKHGNRILNRKVKSEKMNSQQTIHSYESINRHFTDHQKNGKKNEESNKKKSKDDKKQFKKLPKHKKRNSSSFYVEDINNEKAYECMQDLSSENESKKLANIINNNNSEPSYIDVDTLYQIKNCLLKDDHPYTEIRSHNRKPRSSSIQQSSEYSHRELVTILQPRPKERVYGGSEKSALSENYENQPSDFLRKSVHQSDQYMNHDIQEVQLRKNKTPSRSRSVPLRSKSMDCLLEIDFENDFTKCQSQYEILPRPQENRSPPQIPKQTQKRRYFQNGNRKSESTEDMFPAQITLQKEQRLRRPNQLSLQTNYTNNEIISPGQNLPNYEYVNNIKRKESNLSFQESTYGNFQSPRSNASTPESEISNLSYADVELNNSKYLSPQELKESPKKIFQQRNIDEMTTYTLIDVQKSLGVQKAIQNSRQNDAIRQSHENLEKNQREYLTDLSHKTFKKPQKVDI